MPRPRRNKRSIQEVSNTNTSLDMPSTSSLPLQQTPSLRGSSPFHGFDGNIDQTNLVTMSRVLNTAVSVGGTSGEEAPKEMPRPRRNKRSIQEVSNTSLDMPSTSSLPLKQTPSLRGSSPFNGFDGNIDQTNLVTMSRVLNTAVSVGGTSGEEALKEMVKKKRKLSSPVTFIGTIKCPVETKPSITIKLHDLKFEQEKVDDALKKFRDEKIKSRKKSQNHSSNKKKTEFYTDETYTDNNNENKNKEIFPAYDNKRRNFINIFNNLQRGLFKQSIFYEIAEQVALKGLRWFQVCVKQETSDLRVTAMAWHPTNPHLFISGGKAGTLVLYKINDQKPLFLDRLSEIPGIGPGGTMECIKFNTKRSGLEVCTASVDGTVACYNLDTLDRKCLVNSLDPYRVWFCAVDIHQDGKSIYGGDSAGNLAIHHLDCGRIEYRISNFKLHSSKIRHLEFSPRDPNLMVTSSLDKTVKLWDIRKLDGKKSCIETLTHDLGVSAAKFSRTDGCRLLTTDLNSELRVYKAPVWSLEHSVVHPHRHFQHLTIIRASWHPQADLFVVGRYPDPKIKSIDDIRSVDIYSASSGNLCYELLDTGRLITSLAEFNSTGSLLATSSGRMLYFWKQRNSSISSAT